MQADLQRSLLRVRHVYWARNVTWSNAAIIIWIGVTSQLWRILPSWKILKEKCILLILIFRWQKRLVGNSFRRKNFLIQTKLEKLLLGAAGEIFIHHHFERGMGTKLPYSLASMCISVLFAIRGHIGKKDLRCCVEIAFMPALKYAIDFLFNLRWKEQ